MEKKTYISPATNVHRLKVEPMLLKISNGQTVQPLHSYATRVNVDLAMTPTYGGPVFDDEEDYDY